jgi:mono/diheme cytochrome c family protein
MRGFILGMLFALIALIAGAYWALEQGYVNFGADQKPGYVEDKMAMTALDRSADRRAPKTENPVAPTEKNLVLGAKLYLDHCAGCHGVPSNADGPFAQSFYPPVPGFFQHAPDMTPAQNFYIIQHGVRWTGMPAWDKTLSEDQTWTLVAFLSNIEKLPPAAQRAFQPDQTQTPVTMPMPKEMPMHH